MKKNWILPVLILLIPGCKSVPQKRILTADEIHICDSLKIDTALVVELRKYTKAPVELFHYSFQSLYVDGKVKEIDPLELPGLIFKETTTSAEQILSALHWKFLEKGYSLFILDKNFGIDNKPDLMALLHTNDKYELLSDIRTDGINYDITNDSLISLIQELDQIYSLDLIGVGGDWCEFVVNKDTVDWMKLAQECYRISPDVVWQGVGTVEALAEGMQQTKRLYFWWD